MTKTTTTLAASPVSCAVRFEKQAKLLIKGRGAGAQNTALMGVAPAAYSEGLSRGKRIEQMRAALGKAPSEALQALVLREYVAGRLAATAAPAFFARKCADAVARIDYAREMLVDYAAPRDANSRKKSLPKGKIGYRTELQHRLIRNEEKNLSLIKAEIGLGNAQTQADKNAKRKPRPGGVSDTDNMPKGKGKGVVSKDTLGAASPGKATSREDALDYVNNMAATLLMFANKNAKLLPTDYGSAIQTFKTAINAAANAEQERRAKADAKAAEQGK